MSNVSKNTRMVAIRMPRDLWSWLNARSEVTGESVSAVILDALRHERDRLERAAAAKARPTAIDQTRRSS